MSQDNIWDDDEAFNDMPDEAKLDSNGLSMSAPAAAIPRQPRTVPPPMPAQHQEPEQEYEFDEETLEFMAEQEQAFEDVLSDAHLRLEQGSLYKQIINHNLFEGVDADPKAIANVQKEIRQFAKERMEVMLGMRKEASTVETLEIDFPFNQVEVKVLKMFALKMSGGASETSDNYVPEVKRVTQEVSGPKPTPKKKTFNPIGGSLQNKTAPVPQPTKRPLPARPAAPVKRTKLDSTIDQIAREEGIPRELLEENDPYLGKPLNELTDTQIVERNRLISKRRGVQVKSANAIPMPSYEQQAFLAESAAGAASAVPRMSKLIEAAKTMPIKRT